LGDGQTPSEFSKQKTSTSSLFLSFRPEKNSRSASAKLFETNRCLHVFFSLLQLQKMDRLERTSKELSTEFKKKTVLNADSVLQFPYASKIAAGLSILYFIMIAVYTNNLDKNDCACSHNKRRKTIEIVSYIFIAFYAIILIFPMDQIQQFLDGDTIIAKGLSILLVITLPILVILIISFVREMRSQKCDCSENWKRSFMEVVSYIQLGGYVLLTTNVIIPALGLTKA
jgi:hypothetical protein